MNEGTRIFLGILLLGAALWMGISGGKQLRVYYIFVKYPKKTKKVGAILQDAEQKDNVRVGGYRRTRSSFVKHLTKAVYAYTVGGKVYYIKTTHYHTTKRQTPKFVPVVYIASHPKFAYIDDLAGEEMVYVLYGGVSLLCTFLLTFLAFALFGVISA